MMHVLRRALLYARTARFLRPEQVWHLPLRRVQTRIAAKVNAAPHAMPRGKSSLGTSVRQWPAKTGSDDRAKAALAGYFTFLGHEERLPEVDWSQRYVSHLWSYNLHYFDYAVDLAHTHSSSTDDRYVRRFEELALGWIKGTSTGRGDGWQPYAISLRVVNWAYTLWMLGDAVDPEARYRIERSMLAQLAFLERRLELHILANHLQKNLKAMAVGGLYFMGPAAERWLRRGVAGMWRELFEQVLPDGGHYERSPMYHAIALADYLELVDLMGSIEAPVPQQVIERLGVMVNAFGVLSRPDGRIHLFNDAAHGIAPERQWLDRMARRTLGRGVPAPTGMLALPDAGYYGLMYADGGERIVVDLGLPGPTYQPGHAHCDMLSYELDLAGRPVVVDAGVSGYDGHPLREYVRSTRAHNTVSIAGSEQSEVWGTFRVARRGLPGRATQQLIHGSYEFEGECTPYHNRSATHVRRISRLDGSWRIVDRVVGASGVPLSSFIHLSPSFDLFEAGNGFYVSDQTGSVEIETFGVDAIFRHRGETEPAQGWHCPEFGRSLPAWALELVVHANDGREFGYTIRTAYEP